MDEKPDGALGGNGVQDKTYTLEMECRNCGQIENRQFAWGHQITSTYLPCNFCGCDSLGFTGKRIKVPQDVYFGGGGASGSSHDSV